MRIGVIGPDFPAATAEDALAAEQVGTLLGQRGATVICGGLGGVMEAACRGAKAAGATTVGLLPGLGTSAANPYLTVALPTGIGELRNGLIVNASQAIISIGGSWGTLSEIALALRTGTPCVVLHGWQITTGDTVVAGGPLAATTPTSAVSAAIDAVRTESRPRDS